MNEITPEEFARLFPNASASTIARNSGPLRQSKDCSAAKFIGVSQALRQSHSRSKPKVLATSGMSEAESRLNKTERRFLAELRSRTARYSYVGIQEITLRLGWDTRYTPDFNCVTDTNTVQFFEVKGFMRDDARVKLYTAAAKFPWFWFWLVKWKDGKWVETLVKA